jgi:hypothetical protein
LTDVFFFGLPILDRIESSTVVVNLRLYSDNDIDLHRPSSSTARHGRWCRTRGAPTCVAAGCSRPRGLLRRSVFVVIAKDFTDKRHHQLRSARRRPCHGVPCASIGLINRSSARLRQARPRARAYRRPSIGLPLHRLFGPQRRRRLPTRLPRRVRSWWSRCSIDSRPAATLPLRGVAPCARSSSPSPRTDVPGCRHAASHGSGRHIRARSSSTAGFFLAYFDYRRRASSRNLNGLHRSWFHRLHLRPRPIRLRRQRHRLVLDKSTPTTADGFGPSSPLFVSQPLWSLVSESLDMA